MAGYVVEPISSGPDPRAAKLASLMRENGYSDEDIVAELKKRKGAAAPAPAGHGRGDELFQPDPSPSGVVTVGRRLPKTEVTDTGDVDLGKLGMGPVAAYQRTVAGTSAPGAPAANGPEEARGFLRFAGGGLAGMAAGGAARALGAGPGVQGAVGGAAAGAAPSAMAGESPSEIGKNAAIGAAIPTVGSVLSKAGDALMATRGARARVLIEKAGGNVGLKDSGSGLPEFEGIGKVTDADIAARARTVGDEMLAANDQRLTERGKNPYNAELGRIAATREGKNLVDATPVREEMASLAANKRLQPEVRESIRSDIARFDREHGAMRGKWVMTEADLNDYRGQFYDRARFDAQSGKPGAPEWAKVGDSFKRLVDRGPYAEANAKYAQAMGEHGDFREAFGLKRTPSANEQVDERRMMNFLSRAGQSTTTAGGQQGGNAGKRLDAIIAERPELRRQIESPELLRAKADLQAGIPETGGLINRVAPGHLMMHNLGPLTGRVLYNPARAAQAAGGAMVSNPNLTTQFAAMQAAIAEKRQRDTAVIHTIFGKPEEQKNEVPSGVRE